MRRRAHNSKICNWRCQKHTTKGFARAVPTAPQGIVESGGTTSVCEGDPGNSPNTRKLHASLIWIYFAEGDSRDTRIIYAEGKGWSVYGGYWKEQGGALLDFIIALQTDSLLRIQDVRSVAIARTIFKNLANCEIHPDRKHLLGLEISISPASKCASAAKACRPYFLGRAHMDAIPMSLQLQNRTVYIETNTIRFIRPQDFTSEISRIRIPDYAIPGGPGSRTAMRERTEKLDSRLHLEYVSTRSRSLASKP